MEGLFRRASKREVPKEQKITEAAEDTATTAKKGLFRNLSTRLSASKNAIMGESGHSLRQASNNTRSPSIINQDAVVGAKISQYQHSADQPDSRRISEDKESRRHRSEHNLAEEPVASLDSTTLPLTKVQLGRSNTQGQKSSRFNRLDGKEGAAAVGNMLAAKDYNAVTGRTSVTALNKSYGSQANFTTSTNHIYPLAENAPPLPNQQPHTESLLPKLPTLKGARAATDQPTSSSMFSGAMSKSTVHLGASGGSGGYPSSGGGHGSGAHHGLGPGQENKLKSGMQGTASSAHLNPDSFLLSTSAQARQDKRAAGLSAYEINATPAAMSSKRYALDDFQIVRRVGRGGFAIVFLVRMKAASGRYYALKAIRKAEVVKLKQEKQIVNEKEILKNVKHNFIVELFYTFQDTHYLYMIMEYIDGGDLFSYLRKVQKFGDEDSKFYAAEVLMSLQYLHSENVIFRDLKPENILLDMTGHVKLADFGFAKVVSGTTKSFCGTPDYIAREIVLNRSYGKGVDWWSFGVLIFELVSGKTPFQSDTADGIYDNIEQCHIGWNPLIKGACKDIVTRLLEKDPEKRLGSNGDGDEIRAHPWFKTVKWSRAETRGLQPPFLPACEPPEVIERERAARGQMEDYANMLKSGVGGGASAADKRADLSWLQNGVDPFKGF
ncbi:camp-dependent protein kinase catalytic subunit [Chytriomyces hyalinus]|nr:camp-dependent protein kinase catalytic subunit [Chytriomyces hyalinus]